MIRFGLLSILLLLVLLELGCQSRYSRARVPQTVNTVDPVAGIAGELVDIDWIEGEWGSLWDPTASVEIKRSSKGVYQLLPEGGSFLISGELRIYKVGLVRLCVIETWDEDAPKDAHRSALGGVVNGWERRLSLDLFFIDFEQIWGSDLLKQELGIEVDGEIPVDRRDEAVPWLLNHMDTYGTFNGQDFTMYRLSDLEDYRSNIEAD